MDVRVVGGEGRPVRAAEDDRRLEEADRRLELDAEALGDPDREDRTELRDVEALVVLLVRLRPLGTDGPDLGTSLRVHDAHRGRRHVQRERELPRREPDVRGTCAGEVRIAAPGAGLRALRAEKQRGRQRERRRQRDLHLRFASASALSSACRFAPCSVAEGFPSVP